VALVPALALVVVVQAVQHKMDHFPSRRVTVAVV
jgi:hypothetical protein